MDRLWCVGTTEQDLEYQCDRSRVGLVLFLSIRQIQSAQGTDIAWNHSTTCPSLQWNRFGNLWMVRLVLHEGRRSIYLACICGQADWKRRRGLLLDHVCLASIRIENCLEDQIGQEYSASIHNRDSSELFPVVGRWIEGFPRFQRLLSQSSGAWLGLDTSCPQTCLRRRLTSDFHDQG